MKNKELIKLDDVKSIAEFLQQPAVKMAEFLTGVLASDTKDLKYSAGRLVQASLQWKLYSYLGKEINDYITKGKIKEDFLSDHKNQQSLYDLLKFIDEATPDEERFNAVKSLFLKSLSEDTSEEERIIAYQFMKLSKELDSDSLLILKAAFDIYSNKSALSVTLGPNDLDTKSAHIWLTHISKQIGHGILSLVELHEEQLMQLKLISPRIHPDGSGIEKTKYFRLTDLGYKFCEFIYNT